MYAVWLPCTILSVYNKNSDFPVIFILGLSLWHSHTNITFELQILEEFIKDSHFLWILCVYVSIFS